MNQDILNIFNNLMLKYTNGKSNSIKKDTAYHMLNSIYYAIDVSTKNCKNSLISINKEKNLLEIYNNGIEILKKIVLECKALYKHIKKNKLIIANDIYNNTIDIEIPNFFKSYDVILGAQDTIISMSYPITFNDNKVRGIFYMEQYLKKLKIEMDFCKLFNVEAIKQIITNYGIKYKVNILKTPINLFQILLDQCVFLNLLNNFTNNLIISPIQFKMIYRNLKEKSKNEILYSINKASEQIIHKFDIKNPDLIDYIERYLKSFKIRLLDILKSGNLINMVIIEKKETQNRNIIFNKGRRMNDYEFNTIMNNILECEDTEKKLEIINLNVHNVDDYMDILESECLFQDEYKMAFQNLDDISIALIGKVIFYDTLTDNFLKLSNKELLNYKGTLEREWENYYIDFLLEQSEKKIKIIGQIINEINYSENGIDM